MRNIILISLSLSSIFGMGQDYLKAFLNEFSGEWTSTNQHFDFSRNGVVDISDAITFLNEFENDRVVFDGKSPKNC